MSLPLVSGTWQELYTLAGLHAEREGYPRWQVTLCHAGWQAIAWHRLSRWLYRNGYRFLGRYLALWGKRLTSTYIHPAAQVGRLCELSDGGGIYIGESAIVGDSCQIGPGVLLVAHTRKPNFDTLTLPLGTNPLLRAHPALGSRVLIEAGAVLMGDIVIGHDAVVEGGSRVTRDVPHHGKAQNAPARIGDASFSQQDPDAAALLALASRVHQLEEQIQILTFKTQARPGPGDRLQTNNPNQYGPLPAIERLSDYTGLTP
jgi:serine O-acetyltransferase